MTPYDVGMVAVIIAGMIWGAWRGITWQLASILSLGLGYMVAFPMSVQVAQHFPGSPIVARALAMLVLYVAVSAGVFGIAWSIRTTLRKWKFEAYDRHLGMLLGGMEGAALGVVATVFIVSLAPQSRTPILTSKAGMAVDHALMLAKPALPDEVRTMLQPYWEALDRGEGFDIEATVEQIASELTEDREEPESGFSLFSTKPQAKPQTKNDPGLFRSMFERGKAEAEKTLIEQWQGGLNGDSGTSNDRTSRW